MCVGEAVSVVCACVKPTVCTHAHVQCVYLYVHTSIYFYIYIPIVHTHRGCTHACIQTCVLGLAMCVHMDTYQ